MNYSGTKFYFYGLLIGTLLMIAIIFKAFILPLIFALIFSVVFRPLNDKLVSFFKKREGVAALFTTLIIILIILIPFSFVGIKLISEVTQVYNTFFNGNEATAGAITKATQGIKGALGLNTLSNEFYVQIFSYLKSGLNWVLNNSLAIFSGMMKTFINIFVFLGALYYLLKDGKQLRKNFIRMSPLDKDDSDKIFQRLEEAINSIVKGNLVVALTQGIMTGIGFWIFGVSQPVILGGLTSIAALVPALGTSLVFIPVIAFAFIRGDMLQVGGLIIWWMAAVSLIDNFLGPKLIGRGAKVHPFMIFLSVIGGIATFGPVGFFLGPLTVSLFFALIDIHPFVTADECEAK